MWLMYLLQIFFSTLRESCGLDRRLVTRGDDLEKSLVELFDWSFDHEDDEDKPTIVDVS